MYILLYFTHSQLAPHDTGFWAVLLILLILYMNVLYPRACIVLCFYVLCVASFILFT